MISASLTPAIDRLRIPEGGRIHHLAGELEVDMSAEDLYTHDAPKAEIAARLQELIARSGRGVVFIDRARVSVPEAWGAGLSAAPDVTVLLWETLDSGRVREVAASGGTAVRFVELQGPPDLIVEVVSDASVARDSVRLPAMYAQAGVPELWLVDARAEPLGLRVQSLAEAGYEPTPIRGEWCVSPLLDREVRLRRARAGAGRWTYRMELRLLRGGTP
jgi:Uma2 family endonuclease